jgi:hypothetical protein
MPRLDDPELTVSLAGHTAHVVGFLPPSFADPLPFYAMAESLGDRTRVHLVYPIATADPSLPIGGGLLARDPEPFTYTVCGGAEAVPSNPQTTWGGFPFIEYVCRHVDHDGRVRTGIALHGPITSAVIGGSTYWALERGPVSEGCNRMLGEHVLELAHLIGFDAGVMGTPVTVVADFDSFLGLPLDVDYPATGWPRPPGAVVFPIWQAMRERPDGSVVPDFPRWACETSLCASMPANTRDPYTGE